MTPDRAPGAIGLAWAVGLGAASIVFLFVASGLGGDLAEPESAGADSYSYSALGHRAFATLLAREGLRVERRRSRRGGAVDSTSAVLVVEPRPARDGDDAIARRLSGLRLRVAASRGTPVVVVLSKREGIPDPMRPRWIAGTLPLPAESVTSRVREFGLDGLAVVRTGRDLSPCRTRWGQRLAVSLPAMQLLAPSPHLEPVATCDSMTLIARWRGFADGAAPALYVISDPDLIDNFGLGRARNAEVAVGFLKRDLGLAAVRFDETVHHPPVEASLAAELFRFPLVLALAQAMLAVAVWLAASTGRFGKPRPAAARDESKRALVDSISGLLVGAGRPAELLEAYLMQVLQEVAERFGIPATANRTRLLARLGELSANRGATVDVAAVAGLLDSLYVSPRRREHEIVRASRDIHRWRGEMIHDR